MGVEKTKRTMMPIEMTKPIAPEKLLKIIKCNCKKDCTHNKCTFKQFGVYCTQMCDDCRGVSCLNCEEIEHDE